MDLDKNKLELSAETAPFYRRENLPGLLDFVRAVFSLEGDLKAMEQLEGMVLEVLEMIDGETPLECPHHGSYWVTPRTFVMGEQVCPACSMAARMRAEQQRRQQ